jgi:hypothetical protein
MKIYLPHYELVNHNGGKYLTKNDKNRYWVDNNSLSYSIVYVKDNF